MLLALTLVASLHAASTDSISGKWALIVMVLSLINSDTLNAYTGAFQVLALGNMWRRFKSVSVMLRVVPFVCIMAVGVAIACIGYKNSSTTCPISSRCCWPCSFRGPR